MERLYPGAYVHRLLRTIFHRQPIDASIRHRSAENRPRWSHRRSHRNDKSDGNWEQMWSATPVAGILRASSRAPRSAAAHVRVCHAAVLLDDADRAQRGGQVQRRSVPSASPGFDLAVRAANTRSRQVGSAAETRETPGCSGYRYRRGRPTSTHQYAAVGVFRAHFARKKEAGGPSGVKEGRRWAKGMVAGWGSTLLYDR